MIETIFALGLCMNTPNGDFIGCKVFPAERYETAAICEQTKNYLNANRGGRADEIEYICVSKAQATWRKIGE